MKWRCALTQRWLPAYPDGDLPAFWRARIRSHLKRCPACREELAGLEEVARMVRAAAPPEPEPVFWENFQRDLHLKLAQAAPAQGPAPSRFSRWPYLLGAPALVGLLLWVAFGYLHLERSTLAPPPRMAKQEKASEKMAATPQVKAPAPTPAPNNSIVLVTQIGEETAPDDELYLPGDLDSTLAGMTEKEKEAFLKKVRQHEKDGSCIRKYSTISWA